MSIKVRNCLVMLEMTIIIATRKNRCLFIGGCGISLWVKRFQPYFWPKDDLIKEHNPDMLSDPMTDTFVHFKIEIQHKTTFYQLLHPVHIKELNLWRILAIFSLWSWTVKENCPKVQGNECVCVYSCLRHHNSLCLLLSLSPARICSCSFFCQHLGHNHGFHQNGKLPWPASLLVINVCRYLRDTNSNCEVVTFIGGPSKELWHSHPMINVRLLTMIAAHPMDNHGNRFHQ